MAEVLTLVQSNADEASKIAEKFIEYLCLPSSDDEMQALWEDIEYATSSMDLVAEGSSAFHFEPDYVEIEVNEIDLANELRKSDISVVRFGSSEISFSVKLDMSIDAGTNFDLSVWDSIDKEYVGMGSATAEVENFEFQAEYLITLTGDLAADPSKLVIQGVDILDHPDEINFGEIEMDYGEDRWDPDDDLQLDIFDQPSGNKESTDKTEECETAKG